jgi:hypothetical protein
MDLQELTNTLQAQNLHPILIEGTTIRYLKSGLLMIGGLDSFISAVHALDEKVVFVVVRTFSDTDFIYEMDKEDQAGLETRASNVEEVNLQTIEPELEKYREHIGNVCAFKLSVYWKEQLSYIQEEPWWDEFQELCEQAIEKLDEKERQNKQQRAELLAHAEEERRAHQEVILTKVHALIDDAAFVRMFARKDVTQRAMQAYALEVIPELSELSTEVIKTEIQSLSDRMRARKALGEHRKSGMQAQLWNDSTSTNIPDRSE